MRWLKEHWPFLLIGAGLAWLWLGDLNSEPTYPPADCIVEYGPAGPYCV